MTEKPLRLLVIDDDPGQREICRRFLEQHEQYKFDVSEVALGAAGLQLCRVVAPDCVLLDYRLPDLDGLEILRALGGGKGEIPFPVIMMTDDGDERLAAEASRAGAVTYLPKHMLSPESLGRAVADAVAQHNDRMAAADALQPVRSKT